MVIVCVYHFERCFELCRRQPAWTFLIAFGCRNVSRDTHTHTVTNKTLQDIGTKWAFLHNLLKKVLYCTACMSYVKRTTVIHTHSQMIDESGIHSNEKAAPFHSHYFYQHIRALMKMAQPCNDPIFGLVCLVFLYVGTFLAMGNVDTKHSIRWYFCVLLWTIDLLFVLMT